ncbi:MAG: penicillin-binding protein [Acidimicrobiia bacterium]|nr:penicillin-binding protein [Acidimicrobiia bacterium]
MEPEGPSSGMWWATAGSVLLALVMPVVVSAVLLGALYNPPGGDLPKPRQGVDSRITRIFDASGNQLGALRRFETRVAVDRQDIPQILKDAVVSIEDKRFYSHSGLDFQALVRALWADIQGGSYEQGGSTITQQYVKRNYTGPQRTLSRKIREAALAGRVENKLSKDEILYNYVSDVYLGGGAYGVGAAAETYFRKAVKDITLSEAATLAGLIQSPSADEPRSNTGGAEFRRQTVLQEMLDQGRITSADYNDALSKPLVLAYDDISPTRAATSTLVYPPEEVQTDYPYFVDYVRRYLISKYGEDQVYEGGLQVVATLDPRLQAAAEASVNDTLAGTSPPLEMSLVSVEPGTGFVKAMIGGRDFAKSQVNLALGNCNGAPEPADDGPVCVGGGGTGRQAGSAFKPFTLAAAFEQGITPDKVYRGGASYTFRNCTGPGCTIGNAEGGSFGSLPLSSATANSVNTVFAQLIEDVGVPETAEMAHRLGITMVNPEGKQPNGESYGPGLTLGTAEVSPLDMAAAFSVFPNRGMQAPATPVVKVTDAEGKVLEDNASRKGRRVIAEPIADTVNQVLKGVITGGTGTAADIGRPEGSAGKTGTAEEYSDAWFVGYTQKLSTAVWMGYADGQRSLTNIKGVATVFGGTLPAQTWKEFMSQAMGDEPAVPFSEPGRLPGAPTTRGGPDVTTPGPPGSLPPYDPSITTPASAPDTTRPSRPAFSVPPYNPAPTTTAPPARPGTRPTTTVRPPP